MEQLFLHTFFSHVVLGMGEVGMAAVIVHPWMPAKYLQVVVLTTCNAALRVFSFTFLQMHSLLAPRSLHDTGVQKSEHSLGLPTGSQLFSRKVP